MMRPISSIFGRCLSLTVAGLSLTSAAFGADVSRSERFIGPGVRLIRWNAAGDPQALYAVEADTTNPYVRLGVSLGRGDTLGLQPLSQQAQRLTTPERYPIAGVNGDYFLYPSKESPGIPTNAAVLDGELIRTPFGRSCLVISGDGTPQIRILHARAQVTFPDGTQQTLDGVNQPRHANELVLYTPRYGASTRTSISGTEVYLQPEAFPLHPGETHRAAVRAVQTGAGNGPIAAGAWVLSGSGAAGTMLRALKPDDAIQVRIDFDPPLTPEDQVLGGGPRLVRDGRVAIEPEAGSITGAFAEKRHPRTAIGFNGRKVYLVVVDGRQPGYSLGMSLKEIAQVMVDLGCTDAMNVDGGGSSTLWVRGTVSNRPSDGSERPVSNGLLVFSTAPRGDAVRLAPTPESIDALAGAEVPLTAQAEDQYYNPVSTAGDAVQWTTDSTVGAIQNGRFVAGGPIALVAQSEFVAGTVVGTLGNARGEVPVRVYSKPARLEIAPGSLRLAVSAQVRFTVKAFDSTGRPLLLPRAVKWEASPEVGAITAQGTLVTGAAVGSGTVTATVNGVAATAQVEVSDAAPKALEDFEAGDDWKLQTTPNTAGAVSVAAGTARSGKRALRIQYDFTTGTGTRAVYALASRTLGEPFALRFWVYGDGQGEWLRVRLRDKNGTMILLDAARKVDWSGSWREIRVPFSDDIPGPITLDAIYVVAQGADQKPKGALLIDDLTVDQ